MTMAGGAPASLCPPMRDTASCWTTIPRCFPIRGRHGNPTVCTSRSQLWNAPTAAARTDSSWQGRSIAGRVIYELHIGTFTQAGTLDSALDRLDYLVDLGVDFVQLMPVNAFGGTRGWGYDGVLWYAVHEPYGGPTPWSGSSTPAMDAASVCSSTLSQSSWAVGQLPAEVRSVPVLRK